MDDLAVLDLLDCPVCLEKLDVTAKVLPCQHTFCQPCLQKAVNARKELRCPECRTPVYCNIEELPANLLLVRLLNSIQGEKAIVKVNSLRRPGRLSPQDSPRRSGEVQGVPPVQYRLSQTARFPMEAVPWANATFSHRGHGPNELRFNKGDIVLLHRQLDDNWYQGSVNGVSGILPASAVQVIKQLPQPLPLCKALYNFELKDKEKGNNKHCLTFLKDDIISVIRRVDENWAEGKLGDTIGIFPLLFVESNFAAKQILEQSKSNRAGLQNSPSTLRKASPREKATESGMYHKFPDARRKGPRQFLITNALNTINRMVHSPSDRRSVEISTPVLISSSNPAVLSESHEKGDSLSSAPIQVSASYSASPQSLGHLTTVTAFLNSQQHISANMCVALHPYKARGSEELDLQKGEGVRILGPFHEDWLRGMSLVTGKTGVFPSNYVIPVFRKALHSSDQRAPPLTSWNFSSSSLSSMGSGSESIPGQYRRSIYVPTAVVAPVRSSVGPALSAGAQMSLRRGRNSVRKSASLPRYAQPGPLFQLDSTLRRTPSAIVRPQQFQNYQNLLQQNGASSVTAEPGPRPNSCHEFVTLVARGAEPRTHSADSSVILEAKGSLAKSGPLQKTPASAPPSILVKPDTSKSSSEKQVKTVRFKTDNSPTSKRHLFLSSPNTENGRPEQAAAESPKQEAAPGPEMTIYHQRASSAPVQQMENRRLQSIRTMSMDLSASPAPPIKIGFNEN